MPVRPKVSSVILAAGLSSRMEDFKPLLPLAGTTVIEHVLDTFQAAGITDIVVVTGYRAPELISVLVRRRVSYTINDQYREGMYSSVQAGLKAAPKDSEAFFLLPVDVPLVKSHSIRLLVRDFIRYRSDVTYPAFQMQRGHPPLVSAKLIPLILGQNRSDGLRGLLEEQEASARDVDLVDEGVLTDMDTPEDYRKIRERIENAGIPTRAECESLFTWAQTPVDAIKHGEVVAAVARAIAQELNQSGMQLNVRWVEAAGLLHDIAKGQRKHARTGGRILKSRGFGSVAKSVAQHMDLDFFSTDRIHETAVVYLADKLVRRDQCVSIEERFAPAFARYAQGHPLEALMSRRFSAAKTIACAVEKQTRKPLESIIPMESGQMKEKIGVKRN